MTVVTLRILCRDYEAEEIEDEIAESHIPALGICCLSISSTEATEEDLQLAREMGAPEDLMEEE